MLKYKKFNYGREGTDLGPLDRGAVSSLRQVKIGE